ncbi:MAG TPA: PP2C family protein-serine/threonine phosphatase [Bryobacteraceae bacterium]|nr:PP2C family protein-serine/threonine phosphatase [Bryobacteraceae bacterium]
MARPTVPGLDYYSGWRIGASRDVDYLDYFETDGGNFALAVGDVVAGSEGGAPGALLLSSLHAMVRSLDAGPAVRHAGTSPSNLLGDLVQAIHEMFYEVSPEGSYATLFLARYDPVERRLDYCNAGHEAPVVLRQSNGRWRAIPLEGGGPVVGVLRRSNYRQLSLRLQPGDVLAAYTAGLTETRNLRDEEWGYQRMVAAIEAAAELPPREIVEQVLEEAGAFSAPAPRANDMTLWLGRLDKALAAHVPLEAENTESLEHLEGLETHEPAALAA